MKRLWIVLLWIIVAGSPVLAQRATQLPARPSQLPARPDRRSDTAESNTVVAAGQPAAAYPYPYTYSSTPAEGALDGMSNVISSKGNYNLSTSEAAINMTQAQKSEMENHQQYENTYFQMRQSNDAYREKEAGPRPTEEQLLRLAREEAPQPTSPSELNPVNGTIDWPAALQENSFDAQRSALDQLSAKKATHGSLSISDEMAARKTIESMFGGLESQIAQIPPQDYLASRDFLRSLIYGLAHSQLE